MLVHVPVLSTLTYWLCVGPGLPTPDLILPTSALGQASPPPRLCDWGKGSRTCQVFPHPGPGLVPFLGKLLFWISGRNPHAVILANLSVYELNFLN